MYIYNTIYGVPMACLAGESPYIFIYINLIIIIIINNIYIYIYGHIRCIYILANSTGGVSAGGGGGGGGAQGKVRSMW
jgi:hypothetical protein